MKEYINKTLDFLRSSFGKTKRSGGLSLIELLVALALFTILVFVSAGSILSVFDANRRAQSSKTVVDNLNFSIENMARTIRFGTNYHCGTQTPLSSPLNCANNSVGVGDTFLAVTFDGDVVVYRLNGTTIQRSSDGGVNYTNITPPEVVIQYLRFYVFGTTIADTNQPYVLAVIRGYVGSKPTHQSSFFVQTLMSQRSLDI